MIKCSGKSVLKGIAIGRIYLYKKQEYVLTIHEGYTETTADGTFCRFKETPVEKMVFENTYTLNKSNSPKTGDTASLLLWFTLLVVCGGSAAVCAVSMKRRKDN